MPTNSCEFAYADLISAVPMVSLASYLSRYLLTSTIVLVAAPIACATPTNHPQPAPPTPSELARFTRPKDLSAENAPVRASARLPQANIKPLRELGRLLFFDPRLSASGLMSCATCHNPSLHWTDGLKSSVEKVMRRSMSLYNLAWDTSFTWRGGPGTITSQGIIAISAPRGMNGGARVLESGIAKIPGYKSAFAQAYAGYLANSEAITLDRVTFALEIFTNSIISPIAPFDRWMWGEPTAMTPNQVRGFRLFYGKARCATCHDGWRFTSDSFHDIGLTSAENEKNELGHVAPFFKAVGLRNIADRPPYMHDGSLESLSSVVAFYNRGGDSVRPTKSPLIQPLGLTAEEQGDLVWFLRGLSGNMEPVSLPILPR